MIQKQRRSSESVIAEVGATYTGNPMSSAAAVRKLQGLILNLAVNVLWPVTLVFLTEGIAGCTSGVLLHPVSDPAYGYYGGKAISFTVPTGWKQHSGNLGYGASFQPVSCQNRDCPLLTAHVFYLSPDQARSEMGQAQSYLSAIRHQDDARVSMEEIASFEVGGGHPLTVYRFHSTYIRERLMVYLFNDDLMLQIELSGLDYPELQKLIGAIQSVADSVRFSK